MLCLKIIFFFLQLRLINQITNVTIKALEMPFFVMLGKETKNMCVWAQLLIQTKDQGQFLYAVTSSNDPAGFFFSSSTGSLNANRVTRPCICGALCAHRSDLTRAESTRLQRGCTLNQGVGLMNKVSPRKWRCSCGCY